jgi:ATP-binding cassette subfamily C protein
MTHAGSPELRAGLAHCRAAFVGVAVMSGVVNLLYLTGSFFMLEVYDRVIPGRSIPTLLGLAALALALYAFQGVLETLRARILARIGRAVDEALSPRVFDLTLRAPLRGGRGAEYAVRDLDQVRAFLGGSGPAALFDLPWLPVYVAICFVFHPLIGAAAILGAVILVALTTSTELATRGPALVATAHAVRRQSLADAGRRHAEALAALGMRERIGGRWAIINRDYLRAQQRSSDIAAGFGAASKVWRMALQSAVLGLGAYLVIQGQATAGIMIASSILVSRALAPAELAIANWKGFVQARQSWRRLTTALTHMPAEGARHALPRPSLCLSVEDISVLPPGTTRAAVFGVRFSLLGGQAVGVIGASASGKSSLARALVGAWPIVRGQIRLDEAALDQWTSAALGRHVGYLPQEAELLAGSVAENIARFDPEATPEAVIAAAQAAGVHELILRLPDGYDTPLGEDGAGLSAGQRQRIGLARALYGDPFLVVLDEPNANLDTDGEHALTRAIARVRERGGLCVVVAHRPSALAAVDLILTMAEGRMTAFGPKEDVLRRILRPTPVASPEAPARPPGEGPSLPRVRPLEPTVVPAMQESA